MGKPLVVDEETRRFWVLVDPEDGTMWCERVCAEFSPSETNWSHDEVSVFTSEDVARAAATTKLECGAHVVPQEVVITLAKEARRG